MFILENALKMSSLSVLSCISIERYITIRKPFCSQVVDHDLLVDHARDDLSLLQVRKRVVCLTPCLAMAVLTIILAAVLMQVQSVTVSSDGLNCVRSFRSKWAPRLGAFVTAVAFSVHLSVICINYGQIVRHVRRKFIKRRARGLSSYLLFL